MALFFRYLRTNFEDIEEVIEKQDLAEELKRDLGGDSYQPHPGT